MYFAALFFCLQEVIMNRKKTMKREYQAYLYILPWILGFVILQLYPFVSSFIYSFTDYTVGAKATFQGLANYKKLFTQDKEGSGIP